MPYSGGTYTLSDTIANATSADATELQAILDDIATALNLAFPRDGQGAATGQWLGVVGTTPQYSFVGDTNTGLGSDTGDEVYLKAGGVKTLAINATGGTITGTFGATGLATLATLAVTSTSTFNDTMTSTSASAGFVGYEAICTEAGAAAGPILSLYRNSASPAASDVIGAVNYYGKDSGGNKTLYGQVTYAITDTTDTSEDAQVFLLGIVGGTLTTLLNSTGTQIAIPGSLAVVGAATAASATVTGALNGATAAGAMLASQAEQEAGTATNKLVQPGVQKYHPAHPKAWAKWNGSTSTIDASSAVTSITDNGAGDFTLNWTTAFSSANYWPSGMCRKNNANSSLWLAIDGANAPTTAALRVRTVDEGTNALDGLYAAVGAAGDQ